MKKRLLIISILLILVISGVLVYFFVFNKDTKVLKKKEKIVYTDIKEDTNVKVNNDLTLEFGLTKKLSDYIEGESIIFEDKKIEYDDLGTTKVEFSYKDKEGKTNYRFINIDVVDTTSPYASVPSYKKVKVNTDISFIEDFLCADNYDRVLEKRLDGEFDLLREGSYTVKFVAVDSSNNKTEKTFILDVVAQLPKTSNSSNNSNINYLNYSDLYNQYKNDNTKVGIDISRWQGDVDFKKLKENNVEFIMIRLGGQDGIDGEYYIDSKFTQNITGALENGFDVGVYFYSYAHTKEDAKKQAKYVMEHLKDYKITLPIVFDWECWNKFNKMGISLYDLKTVQDTFINEVEKKGYKGSRYGSKNYLTNLWLPSDQLTWLAHYVSGTTYEGEYYMWQRCDTGKVPGINGAVDVDILYLDKYKI